MEKISFALNVEEGWPPVSVEHVWCEKNGEIYKLKNAPFFINGLAYNDQFTAVPDAVNGCIFEYSVIESSGHSLVWVIEQNGIQLQQFKSELLCLGCRIEGFPQFNLHAIDIPRAVEAAKLCELLYKIESAGFALAFPVWRHEYNGA